MHSLTLYDVILDQWLREICISFVQRLRTQTQNIYIVLGN